MGINAAIATAPHQRSPYLPLWYLPAIYLLIALRLVVSVFLSEALGGGISPYIFLPRLLDVAIIFVATATLFVAPSTKRKWNFIGSLIYLSAFAACTQLVNGRPLVEGTFILARFTVPMLLLGALLLAPVKPICLEQANRRLVLLVVLLIIIGFVWLEPSTWIDLSSGREKKRLPAYFTDPHNSAYVALLSLAIVAMAMGQPWFRSGWTIVIIFLTYMITIGWAVRTTTLALLVAGFYLWSKRFKRQIKLLQLLGGFVALSLMVGPLLTTLSSIGWEELRYISSGRTAEWADRFSELGSRGPAECLIGTGLGSQLRDSAVWGHASMDSHNDFIAMFTDLGLVGMVCALALFWNAYKLSVRSPAVNSLWLMMLISSLVSNGIALRPTVAYLFALTVYVAHQQVLISRSAILGR